MNIKFIFKDEEITEQIKKIPIKFIFKDEESESESENDTFKFIFKDEIVNEIIEPETLVTLKLVKRGSRSPRS